MTGSPGWTAWIMVLAVASQIACGKGSSGPNSPTPVPTPTPTPTPVPSASSDLTFTADSGVRISNASNPAAGVDASGAVYLYYEDGASHQSMVAIASDGLNFSGAMRVSDSFRANDSRRAQMPDGTWRLYQWNTGTRIMGSLRSSDGVSFSSEAGTRYTPASADNGTIGVYDAFTDGSQVVLLYLGDLMGANNMRRAVSTDGGLTFSFDRGDLLGDQSAGGGSRTYVDPKQIQLPDGRRRLFVMRLGTEISSFVTSDGGRTFSMESGTRLTTTDFASLGAQSLNDPVPVRLADGRYRIYVATKIGSSFSIVSATTGASGTPSTPSTPGTLGTRPSPVPAVPGVPGVLVRPTSIRRGIPG